MDPHQMPNFQNSMLGNHGQQQQMQQQQYNPMLLQPQYINNFGNLNSFYGNGQVNQQMDPFQQQQQQYLMMHGQQVSMFPHQQQQPGQQQQHQLLQQQQQQQQQQRLLQQHQQQQQQAPQPHSQQHFMQQAQMQQMQQHQQQQQHQPQQMSHQQQLFQEQQIQMEQQRLQQQKLVEEQRMREQAIQRQKEQQERAEAQRREQERLAQLEREREEQRKKMEEAARLAEERRKKEEKERLERENLMRIRQEQLKKQQESEMLTQEMRTKMKEIGEPLSLVATHYLSDLRSLIPLPSENLASSTLPILSDPDQIAPTLAKLDASAVEAIARALSQVDVNDIQTRMDNVEKEMNDLPLSTLPDIFRSIIDVNPEAFDVEPPHNGDVNECELQVALTENELPQLVAVAAARAKDKADAAKALHEMQPSTSSDDYSQKEMPKFHIQIDQQEAAKLRKQMISMGKGPKGNQRKKRDMVESLYDSLTDYFDPTEGQRKRRGRTRTADGDDEDEQLRRDLELIAQMEASERVQHGDVKLEEIASASSDEDGKTPHKRKRPRKEEDRPPTPTEVIQQRDLEWNERQRKRQDKRKRRRVDEEDDYWNNETMAENDSFTKFSSLLEGILDQVEDLDMRMAANGRLHNDDEVEEDDDVDPELQIDAAILEDLRNEAQKLKSWRKLNKIPADRLVKLIYILERNMRDVVSQDGSRLLVLGLIDDDGEDEEQALRELVVARLRRACDAATVALTIMTSYKMPKQVYIEDAIDRAINLCKHILNRIVFPASDSVFRAATGKKRVVEDGRRKKRAGVNNRSKEVEDIYSRISTLVRCFAQLVRMQSLPDTSIHHLASLAISTFFVNNVGVLQYGAISLASNIFFISGDEVRTTMLTDILNSFHRLPPGKNQNNSYRFGAELWISNTTLLVMQLIQSVVKMPKRKKSDEDGKADLTPDTIVKDSYKEAQRLAGKFLQGFLSKCSNKGSKSDGEEDYRRIFDGFLQDLLIALHKPEWPAAEMILNILGTILVQHYRNTKMDMVIRQACLEYLGTITARLRQKVGKSEQDTNALLDTVVQTLVFEEQDDDRYSSPSQVDLGDMTTTDKLKKLEQALIDYLIEKKDDENVSVEYAVIFYACEWYKETAEDLEMAKHEYKSKMKEEITDKERRKLEKKLERMHEKGQAMKDFLVKLVDKKHMRKRSQAVSARGNIMMDSDVPWTINYLAARREFNHCFEIYLKHLLYGITMEPTVGLRTKAMKCLTQIIEVDHKVLIISDVRQAVHSRMMDPNAAVREATIELLGKFLLVDLNYIVDYYNILLERIKDSGTSVRKRVIRIMSAICEKYPNFKYIPDMLSKLVRRVTDEDGVKKLVQETFSMLWFQPCKDRHDVLVKKVIQMTAVAQQCCSEQTLDFMEQLLQSILKQEDKSVIMASKEIVDSLVDNILILERNMAADIGAVNAQLNGGELSGAQLQKTNQDRLLACLTTLSIFSKVRPELLIKHAETLQPYLSMTAQGTAERQVLNEVINMLERVVPLTNHPSDSFLQGLDECLANLVGSSGMVIVESAIRCASAVWHKFPRQITAMAPKFIQCLKNLNGFKHKVESVDGYTFNEALLPVMRRYVFTIGLLARYFNFDKMLEGDFEAAKALVVTAVARPEGLVAGGETVELPEEEAAEFRRYRDNVFTLLLWFSRYNNPHLKQQAITSIGHLCAQYPAYLASDHVRNMYVVVLRAPPLQHLDLKIQTLKNLEIFLANEEKKAIKSNQDWEKSKDQQNLKEMELTGSGLSSAVIQIYWQDVLKCYVHPNETVRSAAVQVTCLTLNQGLVTPGSSIPMLIAMTTDPIQTIRIKVEHLLKEIDTKYAGMVQSKAIAGIRLAFRLNEKIKPANTFVVRGIRACDASVITQSRGHDATGLPRMTNDGQAILSGLYTSLRGNRSFRRSFLNSILRLFSEDSREKLSLEEWIFVADNIAMFPYQVMDEPLYAIRQIDGIISLSGQAIINQFKEHLLTPANMPPEDDDTLFEAECIFRRFPEDKTPLFKLMLNSQACFILLYLKNFLMKLYGFTDAKVQEYSPSEAAKVYEKAVVRKNIMMFQPLSALEELKHDVIAQRNTLHGYTALAHKICSFRKMLLSLDRLEEEEEYGDGGETVGVNEREEEEVDDDGEPQGDSVAEMDE